MRRDLYFFAANNDDALVLHSRLAERGWEVERAEVDCTDNHNFSVIASREGVGPDPEAEDELVAAVTDGMDIQFDGGGTLLA